MRSSFIATTRGPTRIRSRHLRCSGSAVPFASRSLDLSTAAVPSFALRQLQSPATTRSFRLASSAAVTTTGESDLVPRKNASNNGAVGPPEEPPFLPVNFETASKIDGEESQVLTIELSPGQGVRAEAGAMVYMTDSVEMNTQLLSGAMARFMTGQSAFLTDYVNSGDKPGTVCLGTDFYSKIVRLNLQDYGGSLVCQRGAFLASNAGTEIQMEFTKSLTAGFFGGQGFILQRLSGGGDVFVKAGGTLVVKDLEEGETLRVSSGSIVAFEHGIDYDVQMMKGIKNAMFGGEGLFVTTLKGPGRVWLQGMPSDRMIAAIASRVPPGMGLGIPIGMGAGGGGSESSGEEDTGEGTEGGSDAALAGSESVAATDAAIEADRQATVATSGVMGSSDAVDADSPDALFGDAAPKDVPNEAVSDDASFASSSSDTSFSDDSFSTPPSQEPTFDDSSSSFNDEFDGDFSDGELFDDSGASSMGDPSSAGGDEGGPGIISTLWDFFMGGDD